MLEGETSGRIIMNKFREYKIPLIGLETQAKIDW